MLVTEHDGGRDARTRARRSEPDPWSDLEWEEHDECRRLVDAHPDGMTLEEIGAVMGLTRERVRQIEEAALKRLRRAGVQLVPTVDLDGRTVGVPDCERCGNPFVRRYGRQRACDECLPRALRGHAIVDRTLDGTARLRRVQRARTRASIKWMRDAVPPTVLVEAPAGTPTTIVDDGQDGVVHAIGCDLDEDCSCGAAAQQDHARRANPTG